MNPHLVRRTLFAAVTSFSIGAAVMICAILSLQAQDYGLSQRPAAGPFLNNHFPSTEFAPAGWTAAVAFPNLTFEDPTFLVAEPRSNRLWVGGRQGTIHRFENSTLTNTKTLAIDLTPVTQGYNDCGLLGMAFHPDFGRAGSPNRGYLYVSYSYSPSPLPNGASSDSPNYNRLSRFTVPDGSSVADPNSEFVLINQFDRHLWHNGGGMFFGPDGFLYLTNGDEGGNNDPFANGQKFNGGLFSGVLRIDVDQDLSRSHPIRRQPLAGGTPPAGWPATYSQGYTIPNDNPWLSPTGATLEEFYAKGFRSPHRMTYDALTNRIWLGDVGQSSWEEVDIVEKGGNYQWSYREGTHNGPYAKPAPFIGVEKPPIFEYPHANGYNSVIGGYVYRGAENAPYLTGKYIFGDNGTSRVRAMTYDGVNAPTVVDLCTVPNGGTESTGLSSFGVDQNGEIYMCVVGSGTKIYKLTQSGNQGSPPPALLSQTGAFSNLATLTPDSSLIPYTVNSPLWSDNAAKSRWISVPTTGPATTVDFSATGSWTFPIGTVFVKHFELPADDTNPAVRRRLETRFLVRAANGSYYGLTYKWRADNSDADLLPGGLDETYTIPTATGTRSQTWTYPSRTDCMICHNPNANSVLGVRTCQLNGPAPYPTTGLSDNQLRTLNHVGLFTTPVAETIIPSLPKSAPLTDLSVPLEHRIRSYLDSNCAQCHRPNGAPVYFDARLETPLDLQGLIHGPVANDLGLTGGRVIEPQRPDLSLLYVRDSRVGLTQMPPLGKNVVDTNYINALAEWITGLPASSPISSGGSVGKTTIGASDNPCAANDLNAFRFVATNSFAATQMKAYLATPVAGHMKLGIYSDNAGTPGTFLNTTVALTNPGTGWQTFPLATSQPILAGTAYWLVEWADADYVVRTDLIQGTTKFGASSYGEVWPAGSVINTGPVTASDSIYAENPLGAVQNWRNIYFSTTAATGNAADLADPDHDGLSNLLEYALGRSPILSEPLPPGLNPSSLPLSLTFNRVRADISYTGQASSDLSEWSDLVTSPGSIGQPVIITDTPPLGADKRFLRLKVTAP